MLFFKSKKTYEVTPYDDRLIEYHPSQTVEEIKGFMESNNLLKGMRVFDSVKLDTGEWFSYEDISFLRDYTFLKDLDISCGRDQDYSVLDNLGQLESLSIAQGYPWKNPVPLGKLRKLKYLSLEAWRPKNVLGLENLLSLKTFWVGYYNSKNCKSLSSLKTLEHIFFSESKLTSLEGLSASKLKTAVFVYCNQLEEISLLNDLEELEVVVFDHCKKIDLDSDETVLAIKERGVRILTDKNEDEIFERFERE